MLIKQGLYCKQSNYTGALHFLKPAKSFQSYIASNEILLWIKLVTRYWEIYIEIYIPSPKNKYVPSNEVRFCLRVLSVNWKLYLEENYKFKILVDKIVRVI